MAVRPLAPEFGRRTALWLLILLVTATAPLAYLAIRHDTSAHPVYGASWGHTAAPHAAPAARRSDW